LTRPQNNIFENLLLFQLVKQYFEKRRSLLDTILMFRFESGKGYAKIHTHTHTHMRARA